MQFIGKITCKTQKVEKIGKGCDLKLKFLAIKEVAFEYNYSIKFLCDVWKINRRSYYKWLKRVPSAREIENEAIKEKILENIIL